MVRFLVDNHANIDAQDNEGLFIQEKIQFYIFL